MATIMIRGESSDSVPIDLVFEILSRLPPNSIARFCCVSKLWGSMLRGPYFTELFLTRQWARPRLLFALARSFEWSFYSSPHAEYPYLVEATHFHMKFHQDMWADFRGFTSGWIYFSSMRISRKSEDPVPVIFNPRTRQYASLPKLTARLGKSNNFLGFDPIDKQFKVLFIAFSWSHDDHQIVTVEAGEMRWRKIQCPLKHDPYFKGICINGVLYYFGAPKEMYDERSSVLVCFDVRSEKFKFIDGGEITCYWSTTLINYKGKLGVISWRHASNPYELRVAVLEDVEKHEWSKCVYTLPENTYTNLSVAGVTATGEIVLSMGYTYTSIPFYVFYFSPERNTLQRVEIQGLENGSRVYAFVDHVEDLNVNDPKQLKPSKDLNIIRERPQPERSRDLCNSAPSVKNKQPTTLMQNKYELLANLE